MHVLPDKDPLTDVIKRRMLHINSPMQWLSIKPPFMQFRAELGELGVCQVLLLQVTLSDSSHSRVTGMKRLLWHNQLTCCWRLREDKIGMISGYQALVRSCDLMHI